MPALSPCTILVLGDFGHPPAKITHWIKYHGGTQVYRLNQSTTHLVCSEKHWKAKHPTVLAAIELDDAKTKAKLASDGKCEGSKKLNIVTWDWLEDCTIKRQCSGAKKYEWRLPEKKPSRLEDLINKWGELTGVDLSVGLVYGNGGKSANGNVKGIANKKGKAGEKNKGKTLSLVEQELAKGMYACIVFERVETDHRIATQHNTLSTASTPLSTMSSSRSLTH